MADLLALQSDIKRDADGYADDFRLQYRHYKAVLSVFSLHPAQQHESILELVHFIAQVRVYIASVPRFIERLVYRDYFDFCQCQPSDRLQH